MSEKNTKLTRYAKKDYTELIEFPVELVGRDGVVRRYSYEESLVIYQQRIETAYERYDDSQLAEAEMDHCYKRIGQIKRSWREIKERSAGRTPGPSERSQLEADISEECKRFVRDVFMREMAQTRRLDEPLSVFLTPVNQDESTRVFYVSLAGRPTTYLLYLFVFRTTDGAVLAGRTLSNSELGDVDQSSELVVGRGRVQYEQYVQVLNANGTSDGEETLVAQKATERYGLLLTQKSGTGERRDGKGEEPVDMGVVDLEQSRERLEAMLEQDPDNPGIHYGLGVIAVNEGDPLSALDHLARCVEIQPFYLEAYLTIVNVLDHLKRWDEAEPYALMAAHYFPESANVQLALGQIYLQLHRKDDAKVAFTRVLEIEPNHPRARYFLAAELAAELPKQAAPASGAATKVIPTERLAATGVMTVAALALAAGILMPAWSLQIAIGVLAVAGAARLVRRVGAKSL